MCMFVFMAGQMVKLERLRFGWGQLLPGSNMGLVVPVPTIVEVIKKKKHFFFVFFTFRHQFIIEVGEKTGGTTAIGPGYGWLP